MTKEQLQQQAREDFEKIFGYILNLLEGHYGDSQRAHINAFLATQIEKAYGVGRAYWGGITEEALKNEIAKARAAVLKEVEQRILAGIRHAQQAEPPEPFTAGDALDIIRTFQ